MNIDRLHQHMMGNNNNRTICINQKSNIQTFNCLRLVSIGLDYSKIQVGE